MANNSYLPKLDQDFTSLSADSLQQAWNNEAKQRNRRQFYVASIVLLLIVVIGGLLAISWPSLRQGAGNLPERFYDKADQLMGGLKQWQSANEKAVIEGDILK